MIMSVSSRIDTRGMRGRRSVRIRGSGAVQERHRGGGRSGDGESRRKKTKRGKSARVEEQVSESRKIHVTGTELIAAMLEAEAGGNDAAVTTAPGEGARAVATSRIEELTPEFFSVADAYLALARKEGNADVIAQLESILRVAWEVKNASLPAELRLLNQLINARRASERASMLHADTTLLHSNDNLFFRTLEQFTNDVDKNPEARPGSGEKMKMMVKLRTIKKEAKRALAAATTNISTENNTDASDEDETTEFEIV